MRYLLFISLLFLLITCSDERDDIASVEERSAEAIKDLRDALTAPANGWRLDYQPTAESGIFFMLLDFTENGMVTIKSDVVENNGEFVEQTIPYRIDNALGLELIFETYGVFHFLFEQDQAQFGAEFEFLFLEEEDDNLLFTSKTDFVDVTTIVLEPATANDDNLFSLDESENLAVFDGITPQIFGGAPPIQQLVLNNKNMSVFWSIDIVRRVIDVDMVGVGATAAEVSADFKQLNHNTGYALLGGKLVLSQPLTFTFKGEEITIAEVELNSFDMSGSSLCSINAMASPVYDGQISGVGTVTIRKTLLDSSGFGFGPMPDIPYSVNVLFVFDENANSLFEEGIILEKFPNATGFVFYYEFESDSLPANAVGFFVEDENGDIQTYLREFDPTSSEGNHVNISLTNNFYYSSSPGINDEQSLIEITDKIFEGGEVYAYDLPTQGATVFRLFNPCNLYEFFLVQ